MVTPSPDDSFPDLGETFSFFRVLDSCGFLLLLSRGHLKAEARENGEGFFKNGKSLLHPSHPPPHHPANVRKPLSHSFFFFFPFPIP